MLSSPILGVALLNAGRAAPHVLPTAGLAFGLEGPLQVRSGGRSRAARAFVLGPGLEHAGSAEGVHAIALVDDLSTIGSVLARQHPLAGDPPWLRTVHRELHAHAHELEEHETLAGLLQDLLRRAARREGWRCPRPDPRVGSALAAIEDAVRAGVALSRPLVRGISPAHLRSLFKREVGRTISDHARRRRLLVAMAHVGRGRSATHAAHAAGFADSAHLSRTARAAFGTTLRTLRTGSLHVAGR